MHDLMMMMMASDFVYRIFLPDLMGVVTLDSFFPELGLRIDRLLLLHVVLGFHLD